MAAPTEPSQQVRQEWWGVVQTITTSIQEEGLLIQSFDWPVAATEAYTRTLHTQMSGDPLVYDKRVVSGCLYRQITRLAALQYAICVPRHVASSITKAGPISE